MLGAAQAHDVTARASTTSRPATDGPGHRPGGDRTTFGHQLGELFDEHPARTVRVRAPPGALAPPQKHRNGPGHIMQPTVTTAPTRGHDPAVRAAHQLPGRGHGPGHQIHAPFDGLDVDALQAQQRIAARTGISSGGRAHAPRSVSQRRGPLGGSACLVATDLRGPRRLPHQLTRRASLPTQ